MHGAVHDAATATSQSLLHQWVKSSPHQPGSTCTRRQPASSAAVKRRSAVSPSHSPTTHTQPPLSAFNAWMVCLVDRSRNMRVSQHVQGDVGMLLGLCGVTRTSRRAVDARGRVSRQHLYFCSACAAMSLPGGG